MSTDPNTPGEPGHARRLASGSLAQQISQVTGLLAMFAIVTVLAREYTLPEFGVYGLLASLAGYLLVVQNAAASAAVRSMSAALDDDARSTAFSTAVVIYIAAGALTGLLVAAVGLVLSATVDLSASLEHDARLGAVLLGLVTAVGLPITIYRDALRASQNFVLAASIEVASLVVYAALVLGLAFSGASIAVVVAASGAIPLLAGTGCFIVARARRLPFHFSRHRFSRAEAREFARLAGYVSAAEVAGTLIYAMDRIILGVFKNAATVGLYEGPVRAHNLVRSLNAAVTVTVLPTASRFVSEADERRLRELVMRGIRYTLALVVPLVVTGMVLAAPILDVWLGPEFREGGLAMAILMSYWLVNGCTGVLGAVLVAGDRAHVLARYAWIVAVSNLAISLALTPWLGLEGVTIGTALPYFAVFPFTLRQVRHVVPVGFAELFRESFLPAYVLGAVLAGALVLLRVAAPPETVPAVLAAVIGGIVLFWVAFYALVMRPGERGLVRDIAGGLLPGRRA